MNNGASSEFIGSWVDPKTPSNELKSIPPSQANHPNELRYLPTATKWLTTSTPNYEAYIGPLHKIREKEI
jgi:hypothetical protein